MARVGPVPDSIAIAAHAETAATAGLDQTPVAEATATVTGAWAAGEHCDGAEPRDATNKSEPQLSQPRHWPLLPCRRLAGQFVTRVVALPSLRQPRSTIGASRATQAAASDSQSDGVNERVYE